MALTADISLFATCSVASVPAIAARPPRPRPCLRFRPLETVLQDLVSITVHLLTAMSLVG
ncbi:hypothetical protein [Planomonospora parontospora]|uniref:hypothetical protein n=1 Tax=Planomonospora parontospora TaxID=58119 RepID=UPI001670C426|nr:hypothetical protein [Planomonospora parontospora]